MARNIQQDADGYEAHNQRRAAVANERQCQPGEWKQRGDDGDVDQRLEDQPAGQADSEQRGERVGRAAGDSEAAVGDE